tara:strand:+ start:517 stop:1308 length:792 start_codon:yes stop_codon:yes gene_type:complete
MTIIYDLSKVPADVVAQIHASPKYTKWFSEFPTKLLGVSGDAKTVKGEKYGVLTAIFYGSPASSSGVNMCAMAETASCIEACLNTAGRGAMTGVQMSRLRKTLFMLQYWALFEAMLLGEIQVHANYCRKHGYKCAVRLNGTTDIRWELKIWEHMVYMHLWYDVYFYDYTKIANRLVPDSEVYDLTFSYSGVEKYQKYVDTARAMGMRMAVVFRYRTQIPKSFLGMDVVDGDDSDLRFLEPHGVVSALYAKGRAVRDTSGFVVG